MAKPSKHKQPGVERSDTPGSPRKKGFDPEGIAELCICCCDPFGIRLFCFASLSGGVAALNPRLRSSDAFGMKVLGLDILPENLPSYFVLFHFPVIHPRGILGVTFRAEVW